MKSLVFDQGIIPKDIPAKQVGKNQVAIKPCRVLISSIENSIYLGLLWVNPSTVLGSIGMGKVAEVGVELDPSLRGRKVLVSPYSSQGGIGTEIDGLLTEEAVIPYDAIEVLPNDIGEEAVLLPFITFARKVKEKVGGGNLLLIGGGLFSLTVSILLSDQMSSIGLITEEKAGMFRQFGVEDISNLERKWDYVIISTMRTWARFVSPSLIREKGKIFVPNIMKSWPVIMSPEMEKININDINEEDYFILRKKINLKTLEQFLTFSDDFSTAIPSSGLGTIVRTDIAFKRLIILP
ncbi:hypothetical protein [Sulfuracidifex tepidarius]|uniref:Uncharacterized protein n=1 Tax=Sulfuracidifex tepidarius TaxID=1294262 RepID=A0A510DWK6_9CREN|nr:hypothetical protein [Sulfuracidifex tepidarius]BBG24611.1 hypothetical protein IC006_1940 [Sulfuracidifex tepidarius]BBG27399.1 hypothetical protein IC007_1948 [Sulfuracidifex tepidarius]